MTSLLPSLQLRWFVTFLVALLIVVQYGSVFRVAVLQPIDAVEKLKRLDCLASLKGGKRAGASRDCSDGQGRYCTLTDPCTPCQLQGSRCRSCENGESPECIRIQQVGPYCRFPVRGVTEEEAEEANIGEVWWKDGKRYQIELCDYCCVPSGGFGNATIPK